MTTAATWVRPGDIGFGPIKGLPGLLVGAGHLMLGETAHVKRVKVRHVFVSTGGPIHIPWAVEAMPSGARRAVISDRWTDEYVYLRPPGDGTLGIEIGYHAARMVGIKYSFADYAALGLKHRGVKSQRLDDYIARLSQYGYPKRAICSQLADFAITKAGYQVFDDGRLPQDVIPGELFLHLWLARGWEVYWPGRAEVK